MLFRQSGARRQSRSEIGIDFAIVARIVFVIAVRLENGIKIYARYAERFQIAELFYYAAQIAAEEIFVTDFSLRIGTVRSRLRRGDCTSIISSRIPKISNTVSVRETICMPCAAKDTTGN